MKLATVFGAAVPSKVTWNEPRLVVTVAIPVPDAVAVPGPGVAAAEVSGLMLLLLMEQV